MTGDESPGPSDREGILNMEVASRSSAPFYREYLWMIRWRIAAVTLLGAAAGGVMGWLFL